MTELNLTLVLENLNISEDIKKAIKMLKGVISISDTSIPSNEEKKKKHDIANKLCGSVSISDEIAAQDEKLKIKTFYQVL